MYIYIYIFIEICTFNPPPVNNPPPQTATAGGKIKPPLQIGLHNWGLPLGVAYAPRGCTRPPRGELPHAIPTKWDRFSGAPK